MHNNDDKNFHDLLDEKFRALSTFARGAAHDLNNILTHISGNISLALDYVDSDAHATKHKLEEAEKALIKAKDFITSMVAMTEAPSPVVMSARLDDVIRSAAASIDATSTKCDIALQDLSNKLKIDPQGIECALRAIIDNAVKASPEGRRVMISAEETFVGEGSGLPLKPGDYAVITVSDDGPGIEPDRMPRIFEPYFRIAHKGKGLGLATAYTHVRGHGGCITASSVLGTGTTVKVYLPVEKLTPTTNKHAAGATKTAARRMLVVTGQGALCELLSEILNPMGFTLERATNIDGSMEGFSVALVEIADDAVNEDRSRLLSLLSTNPSIKTIVSLPASAVSEIESELKARGAFAVVRRPYDVPALVSAMMQAAG